MRRETSCFPSALCEKKKLSADEAPPVMQPVAGPVVPWPGTSETAEASSSSSGVVLSQPTSVEPDPIVRRGLRRASEGEMEIAEICSLISDVNVNVWWSSLMRPVFFYFRFFSFFFLFVFFASVSFSFCFRGSSHSGAGLR